MARSRFENTLGVSAKKFIELLRSSKTNLRVNISEASKALKIQKRIIYDIINVLEGIGIVERTQKNEVKWKDGNIDDLQLFNTDLKDEDLEKNLQEFLASQNSHDKDS